MSEKELADAYRRGWNDRARHEKDALCSVEGCERKQRALGMCQRHYQRFHATGTTGDSARMKRLRGDPAPPCSVEGCDRDAVYATLGLCNRHYEQLRRRKKKETGPCTD